MKTETGNDSWMLVLGLIGFVVVIVFAAVGGATAKPLDDGGIPVGNGGLLARSPDGRTVDFPLDHTSVDIAVSGFLARAQVRQTFSNPSTERIEALYVFPLPENAAVDDMTMRIGDRVIRGLIKEKEEASRIYREARRSGRTAALLNQERPNIFTQAVANILPGDAIEISITYVQNLAYRKGTLSLAFPMVVGPRFIPGASVDPDGTVSRARDESATTVTDAERITPPVLRPGTRSGHDISLRVTLGAGVPFDNLRSRSHSIFTTRHDSANAVVELSPADSIPNKDFILEWNVEPERVETGLLTHRSDDQGFFSLMMVPPVSPEPEQVTPKEMVFVLDCSGSMSGHPMEQAKSLVRHALNNLNPGDSFQIINFSLSATGMAPLPLPNTRANVEAGLRYLDGLHGGGGTMMLRGIEAAMDFPNDPERLRVVLFLTDGYIGNETQILGAIRKRNTRARLFSLGVGSSVNRYLLENMAIEGRGTVRYVRYDEDATAAIEKFYDEIRSPVLTDVEIDWGGLEVTDILPARIPDVFAGHPILVTGRYNQSGRATVRVRGRMADRAVTLPVAVTLPHEERSNSVLRTLWARKSIGELMRQMLQGEKPKLVRQVTDLSIAHRVLSKYTAFVAVEEKVRTNERGDPVTVEVPVEIPDGVSFDGVFGTDDEDGDAEVPAVSPGMLKFRKSASVSGGGAGIGATGKSGGGMGYGRVMGYAARAIPSSKSPVATAEPMSEADRSQVEQKLGIRLTVETATGALIPAEVRTASSSIVSSLKRCCSFVRSAGQTLPSELMIRIVTDGRGKVSKATLVNPPKGLDPSLKHCVERMFRALKLTGAGDTTIRIEITG